MYRKSNVVFEVGSGSGALVMSKHNEKFLRCTLDVCGGCGRTTTFVQNPLDWLSRAGYDAVFDTSGTDPG
ncbi:MAG: hypothetical protein U5R31_00750 [Acidimicrobiia bacterium]|nr:hypothetical protein [Acidimicrobiia bacterium]